MSISYWQHFSEPVRCDGNPAEMHWKADSSRNLHARKCGDRCPNLDQPPPPFGQVSRVAYTRMRSGGCVTGERTMTKLVIDIVLFSCMFAFVTGIVIAAANLLI